MNMKDVIGSISVIRNFMGNAGRNTCNEYLYDALIDAVESMEKHIPKAPVFKNGESVVAVDYANGHGEMKKEKWAEYVCPNCGWFVGQQYISRKHNQQKSNFCSKCGTPIDWNKKDNE